MAPRSSRSSARARASERAARPSCGSAKLARRFTQGRSPEAITSSRSARPGIGRRDASTAAASRPSMRCHASPRASVNRQSLRPGRSPAPVATWAGRPPAAEGMARRPVRAPQCVLRITTPAKAFPPPLATAPRPRPFTSEGAASSARAQGRNATSSTVSAGSRPSRPQEASRASAGDPRTPAPPRDVSVRQQLPDPERPELPGVRQGGPAARSPRRRRLVERSQPRGRPRLGRVRRREQRLELRRPALELPPTGGRERLEGLLTLPHRPAQLHVRRRRLEPGERVPRLRGPLPEGPRDRRSR